MPQNIIQAAQTAQNALQQIVQIAQALQQQELQNAQQAQRFSQLEQNAAAQLQQVQQLAQKAAATSTAPFSANPILAGQGGLSTGTPVGSIFQPGFAGTDARQIQHINQPNPLGRGLQ